MKNAVCRHQAPTCALPPAKTPFLLILLLSILSILCWIDTAAAAPTPVLSIVASLRGHPHSGISLGVGDGGNPFRGIHRPYFQPRADFQDVDSSIRKRSVESDAAAAVDDASEARSDRFQKRRRSSSNGYTPGGTGSGGQYDKGQPYGR